MIAIVDYGVGNLYSLSCSLKFIGAESKITSDEGEIRRADKIILPGVGAFGDAMKKLTDAKLDVVLMEQAQKGTPLLGICLGMQMLFDKSFEYGLHKGLGLIKGEICALEADIPKQAKVPQMGWNALKFERESPLFKYINEGDCVYFVHSYYAKNCDNALIASTDYYVKVPAAVQNNNVYGTQFHPEKSGEVGLKILLAFNELS